MDPDGRFYTKTGDARRVGLAPLHLIADRHRSPHGDDSRGRRPVLRRQNADLAEDLARLTERGARTPDRHEVAGLELIVTSDVDLNEVADAERLRLILRR